MAPVRRHLLLVAMNYAPEPSGTAPYTTALAAHLARLHDVTALVGVPHYPQWRIAPGYGAWRSLETVDGVRLVRLRHHVPSSTAMASRLLHEVSYAVRAAVQRTGAVDAVLAVTPPLFGLAAARLLARRCNAPLGIVVQDLYSRGTLELGASGAAATASARLESSLLRAADQVCVIHETFRTSVVGGLGVPAAAVSVIPNWTHAEPSGSEPAAMRARLGWGTETVALHAGNMGSKQGLETLVDAARIATDRRLPLRFVLMGDGNQRVRLEEAARGVPALDFMDAVGDDEYGDVLAAADVLVVNEKPGVASMSVPSKLTSYFAARRPVVGSCDPDGAAADLIRAARGGLVVEAGVGAEVVGLVMRLRDDPALAASLAAAGSAWARENLSADRALGRYSQWVDDLVGRRVTAPRRRGARPRRCATAARGRS